MRFAANFRYIILRSWPLITGGFHHALRAPIIFLSDQIKQDSVLHFHFPFLTYDLVYRTHTDPIEDVDAVVGRPGSRPNIERAHRALRSPGARERHQQRRRTGDH